MNIICTISGIHPESGGPSRTVPQLCESLAANGASRITGRVDLADVENARNQIRDLESSRTKSSVNLSWQEMGPDDVGGRTRALMLDKDSVNVIYAGGVAGGE